jgi:dTDP-4-dehydrorhamnose reductase
MPLATPKKIYLFGATSMAGWALYQHAPSMIPFCNSYTKVKQAAQFRRINLDDRNTLSALLKEDPPQVLVHCGGICDVDQCEDDPEWAESVNVRSMETIVQSVPSSTRIVYLSSDHVFSGNTGPYNESSKPDPISVYGRSRVAAENILMARRPDALILRSGLCVGPSINGKSGHLDWLKDRTNRFLPTTVVQDEYRCATWTTDFAARLAQLVESSLNGIRHIVTKRAVSRQVLAHFLNEKYQIGAHIHVEKRSQRTYPHLGKMQLVTKWTDPLATPLDSVAPMMDSEEPQA